MARLDQVPSLFQNDPRRVNCRIMMLQLSLYIEQKCNAKENRVNINRFSLQFLLIILIRTIIKTENYNLRI